MKSLPILWAAALIVLCVHCTDVTAGRLALRRLSPSELKKAITEVGSAGGEEGSPDGRSISSALAGIKGFALGVKSGIGGALLFDVITSEQAIAYLSDLMENANNNVGNGNGNGNDNTDEGTIQEVCFNERSMSGNLRQLRNNEAIGQEYQADNEDFYYDDDEEEEHGVEDRNAQSRQLDNLDIYVEPLSSAITCLVVNTGQPILRHRRSIQIRRDYTLLPAESVGDKPAK